MPKRDHLPYNDVLVVIFDIAKFMIHRLLVDNGSLMNIIYWSMLYEMGKSKSSLQKDEATLVGFDSKESRATDTIMLLVTIRRANLRTNFIMFEAPLVYNVILRRPQLYRMKAIPSTYHQKIKFSNRGKIVEIKMDQIEFESVTSTP